MKHVVEEFHRLGLKPRPGQVEAAQILATSMLEAATRERAVFIAPPGFGKTPTVLVALRVSRTLPATWRVRSYMLAHHISEQCAMCELRPEILLGREKVCPLYQRYKHDIHEWCRAARHRCSLFRARTCPYFFFNVEADVFIAHYNRAQLLPTPVTIWDEAHNLLAAREYCLSMEDVTNALAEMEDPALRETLDESFFRTSSTTIEIGADLKEWLYREYLRVLLSRDKPTVLGKLYRLVKHDFIYFEEGRFCGACISLPRRGLLVSATLPMAHQIAAAVLEIPWQRKLRAFIASHLTTRFDEFDDKMAERAKAFLLKLHKKYERILVFATQRVAKRVASIATLYEPESVPADWRGVLLLHTRGRFGEGVDIRADVVVVLGAPYLPPGPNEKLNRAMEQIGIRNASEITMLNTTLQCVGRATRTPKDDPLIILADYRFKRYEGELSKYFEFTEGPEL
uniref:ATP-dependent helicase C-terminal domain-containing protein n=1 Tax=Thermofilum pendens TaxID=2269 RepID=A0A7C4BB36_THEPE